MIDLKGKVIVVTGGANRKCDSSRYITIVKAQAVADEIKDFGGEAIAVNANVKDEYMVKQLIVKPVDTFGEINMMCNNAGTISMKFIEGLPV